MFKITAILILLFSFFNVASADTINCLDLERRQNRLTFFYDKKDPSDKPYFYVKVLASGIKSPSNFDSIKSLKDHLFHVSGGTQYEIPKNAQKIYIIKSLEKLDVLAYASQVIPSTGKTKKRGASNHPKLLPSETRNTDLARGKNVLDVCEHKL